MTAIATDEDTACLNAINMAIEDILSVRRLDSDVRHDGQLVTKAPLEITSVNFPVKGNTSAILTNSTSFVATDLGGEFIVRVVPTGDDEYANTPFRIDQYASPLSTTAGVSLSVGAPVAETITGAKLIYSEYVFPDTVREVIRFSHQEEDMNLEILSGTSEFDEWIPNSAIDDGEPQVIAIGGYDEKSHESTQTVVPQLRGIVWPVPDDEYILNYSYYYRHPELTAADSVLEGVPQETISDIVYQATSIMGMAWDGNFAMAHFGDIAQTQATAKSRASMGGAQGRHTVHGWGSRSSGTHIPLGFPGKIIGGS